MDYGNREVVSSSSLVELPPDVADLHVLAYPYWLLRVKNIETNDAIERVSLLSYFMFLVFTF